MLTYKMQFNKKYGFEKDASHSIYEIAQITGYNINGLQTILSKGIGAYFSNNKAVRPSVQNATHWGISRIYSAVMGGKASIIDANHLYK